MYQIQIRLYEVSGRVQAYGHYSREYAGKVENLGAGKASVPIDADSQDDLHLAIMLAACRVCGELAQNLEDPLF